jgi:hypothetical protein
VHQIPILLYVLAPLHAHNVFLSRRRERADLQKRFALDHFGADETARHRGWQRAASDVQKDKGMLRQHPLVFFRSGFRLAR